MSYSKKINMQNILSQLYQLLKNAAKKINSYKQLNIIKQVYKLLNEN